ncbi:MAG: extracellular solute-binding protein [Patescibacteria group bacterium]|nr:extracellular solute-binding protein [Patescibacteria group bacterium]
MKSLPKFLVYVLPVLAVFSLLAAGAFLFRDKIPFLAPKPEEVTLTYWGLFEPREVLEPLIKEYQEENPHVTIDYTLQSYTTFARYKETLYTRLQQGAGPDIARMHATWVPQFNRYLATSPPSIFESFSQDFYPVVVDSCTIQGKVLAAPLMYDGLVIIYNKDLFRDAAISAPPETWKEFRDVATKLTNWQGNDPRNRLLQAGAAIGSSVNVSHASDIVGLMLAQSDVQIPSQLSSRASQDVFTFYTNFVATDHIWDETWPTDISAFAEGKVGMLIAPSWQLARLEKMSPGFEIGVTPVPQVPKLEGGLTEIGWANFWVEGVSANTEHAEEAWKFLKFLSEKSSQEQLMTRARSVKGFSFASPRQDMRTTADGEYLSAVLRWAQNSRTGIMSSCSGNTDYVSAVNESITDILGGASVASCLEELTGTLGALDESSSLGLQSEPILCSLASFGLEIPSIEKEEVEEPVEEEQEEATPSAELEEEEEIVEEDVSEEEQEVALTCEGLTASPLSGEIPLDVTFSARPSHEALVNTYRFAYGDGNVDETTSSQVTHTYSQAGTYTASVRIEDTLGNLTPQVADCEATISALRPEKDEASPSADMPTGYSIPTYMLVGLGFILLTLGLLF